MRRLNSGVEKEKVGFLLYPGRDSRVTRTRTHEHSDHSLKVPAHNKPSAVEIEREGQSVQRECGRDGVDKVLAPG